MKSCSNGRWLANRIDAIDPLLPVALYKNRTLNCDQFEAFGY
jgi:hypothetical protein